MVCAAVHGAGLNLQQNNNIFSVEETLMEMAALQSCWAKSESPGAWVGSWSTTVPRLSKFSLVS